MKRNLQTACALVSLLTALSIGLAACSTGSSDTPAADTNGTETPETPSGGNPTTPTTPTTPETPSGGNPTTPTTSTALTVYTSSIPTMADLAGTWVAETTTPNQDKTDADSDGDTLEILGTWSDRVTRAITLTDSTHGTYLEVEKKTTDYPDASGIVDVVTYTGRKGSITLSGGVFTVAQTDWISPSSTPLDIATVATATWTAYASTTVDNCAIIDGKFYAEVFKRTAAGTGIEGTWSREMSSGTSDYRFTHTYTGSSFTSSTQYGTSGVYSDPIYTKNYTFTVTSATSIHVAGATKGGADEWDQNVYLGADVVALPKIGYGWVKQ